MIDTHFHIFPDDIAKNALSVLSEKSGMTPSFDGTLSGVLENMEMWNINRIWVLNIATNLCQMQKVNDFAFGIKSDKIFSLGSVYPSDIKNVKNELDRIQKMGINAIKIHPFYQKFDILDEKFYFLFEELEKRKMLAYFHAGLDIGFPNQDKANPKGFRNIVKTFPKLDIVCAHLGGWKQWDLVEKHLCGLENVHFDTSALFGQIDINQYKRIIHKHYVEKIMFASDAPWSIPTNELKLLKKLGLSQNDTEQITHINADKLAKKFI